MSSEILTNEQLIEKGYELMRSVNDKTAYWELSEFIPLYSEIVKRFEQLVQANGCCKKSEK